MEGAANSQKEPEKPSADFSGVFSIKNSDGYSYDIEYNITNPKATLDTTKGKGQNGRSLLLLSAAGSTKPM
jgi:hypothetical protein